MKAAPPRCAFGNGATAVLAPRLAVGKCLRSRVTVAFENVFHCRTITLTGAPLFVHYARSLADDNVCVVSGPSCSARHSEPPEVRPVGKAFVDKHPSAHVFQAVCSLGDVAERDRSRCAPVE
jgi:hypothetical protein